MKWNYFWVKIALSQSLKYSINWLRILSIVKIIMMMMKLHCLWVWMRRCGRCVGWSLAHFGLYCMPTVHLFSWQPYSYVFCAPKYYPKSNRGNGGTPKNIHICIYIYVICVYNILFSFLCIGNQQIGRGRRLETQGSTTVIHKYCFLNLYWIPDPLLSPSEEPQRNTITKV